MSWSMRMGRPSMAWPQKKAQNLKRWTNRRPTAGYMVVCPSVRGCQKSWQTQSLAWRCAIVSLEARHCRLSRFWLATSSLETEPKVLLGTISGAHRKDIHSRHTLITVGSCIVHAWMVGKGYARCAVGGRSLAATPQFDLL